MKKSFNEKDEIQNLCIKNKRYANIDLLKTIAIIMVIALHVPLFYTNFFKTKEISNLVQYSIRLSSEGVLIFVLVNGFLLMNKPLNLKKHIFKTIKIFLLLILWGLLSIILKSCIRGQEITIQKIVHYVLTIQIAHNYCGFLWFLQSLINLYLIFPFIKYLHDNNEKLYKYLFYLIIFFSVGINLLDLLAEFIGLLTNHPNLHNIFLNNFIRISPFTNNMFLLYFILGGYLHDYNNFSDNKKMKHKCIIFGLIAWLFALFIGIVMSKLSNATYRSNYNYYQIFLVVMIIGIYTISTYYVNKNNLLNKLITSIGKNTMGIYLIHEFFIELINKIYHNIQLNFLGRTTFVLVVLILSWSLSVVISKIPKINKIITI